ncbi:MAG: hypothetical protein PHZ00_02185 [Candidatus Peribacteraceae bacterium]|nr:hypothetical protein [Candidatus Peribacteraceae bacterium]
MSIFVRLVAAKENRMHRFILALWAVFVWMLVADSVPAAEVKVTLSAESNWLPLLVYKVVDPTPAEAAAGKRPAYYAVDKLKVGETVKLYVGGVPNYQAYTAQIAGWDGDEADEAVVTPTDDITLNVRGLNIPWNAHLIKAEFPEPWAIVWIETPDWKSGSVDAWFKLEPKERTLANSPNAIAALTLGLDACANQWAQRADKAKERCGHISAVSKTPISAEMIKHGLGEILKHRYPSPTVGDAVEHLKKK